MNKILCHCHCHCHCHEIMKSTNWLNYYMQLDNDGLHSRKSGLFRCILTLIAVTLVCGNIWDVFESVLTLLVGIQLSCYDSMIWGVFDWVLILFVGMQLFIWQNLGCVWLYFSTVCRNAVMMAKWGMTVAQVVTCISQYDVSALDRIIWRASCMWPPGTIPHPASLHTA